jgi:hypothetical protein
MHRYEYKTLWSNHATAADNYFLIEAFVIDFIMDTSRVRDLVALLVGSARCSEPALIIVSKNEVFFLFCNERSANAERYSLCANNFLPICTSCIRILNK